METILESTKPGLRVVLLGNREGEEEFDHYEERFAARGVRLIPPEDSLHFLDAIVKMEEILAEEKRAEEEAAEERRRAEVVSRRAEL